MEGLVIHKGKLAAVMVIGAPYEAYCQLAYIQYVKPDGEPYGVKERPEGFVQFIPVNPTDLVDAKCV